MRSQYDYFEYAKRLIALVRTSWLMLGLTVAILVGLEISSDLLLRIRDSTVPVFHPEHADGYDNVSWATEYFREFESSDVVTWEPYIYWRRKPFHGRYINVDDDGIRQTTLPQIPDADALRSSLRIFMFGGSAHWGTGARDAYTIPSLLVQVLSDSGITAEITNFGETGYVSTQEVIELLLQLQKGNVPDLAIFYDGINDTFSAFQNRVAGLPQNEQHREEEFNLLNPPVARGLVLSGLKRSRTARVLRAIARRIWSAAQEPLQPETGDQRAVDVVSVYLSNVKLAEALGKAFGFVPIFFWQPAIFTKDMLTRYEQQRLDAMDEAQLEFYERSYHVLRNYQPRFADHHFFDISDVFTGTDDPLFIDAAHVTETGNRIIANRIANHLMEVLR